MKSFESRNNSSEIVFELYPVGDKAGKEPRYNGVNYHIMHHSYPEEAKGWVNEIYYPRQEHLSHNLTSVMEKDYCLLKSMMWRETEETGFGIFEYEDTDVFHIFLENADYDVTITFCNPEDNPYQAAVKADKIKKADRIEVDRENSITFCTSVVKNELILKILPVCYGTSREKAGPEQVYIKQITIKRKPDKKPGLKPTVFLASDSTVQTYSKSDFPQAGWGEMLIHYFKEDTAAALDNSNLSDEPGVYETKDIRIDNRAIGGRSSRSFLEEGRFDDILKELKPGDYVFVQFGHNDATAARPNRYVSYRDFAGYLQYYIDGVRQRKGICVLVTPVERRSYDEKTGLFHLSFPQYREVMLNLSREQNIPLLDLGLESTFYLNTVGPERSKKLYLWTNPGEYPESRYASGVSDNTHLQKKGAFIIAGLVIRLITGYHKDRQLDVLKNLIKDGFSTNDVI
ncbi:rhamnogalacturonan acetylesterase [Anaerocolumna sp. MB42-C2]|uniref:rhamnogalacturonan acetylesterase n=1 Tax=Anaerocolumna sp. MB42-C2 TaxID=3070997 RepID=UPI0027E11D10|nr:rhamnogalacturonan acetylesterase [Anaerocolumna sp. MB42-C2]WMJ86524.1 rhamnogalacturonan acetylesterase [Anaerocolumna sp. MB42-C2]